MTEEIVYNGCKLYLEKNKYILIAGDPPKGTDPSLPFIEIKDNSNLKGSKNSFIPDLIAYKNNKFYIIECKVDYNHNDYLKLIKITTNSIRKQELYNSFLEKNIFKNIGAHFTFDEFSLSINGYICYGVESKKTTENNLFKHIIIKSLIDAFIV